MTSAVVMDATCDAMVTPSNDEVMVNACVTGPFLSNQEIENASSVTIFDTVTAPLTFACPCVAMGFEFDCDHTNSVSVVDRPVSCRPSSTSSVHQVALHLLLPNDRRLSVVRFLSPNPWCLCFLALHALETET